MSESVPQYLKIRQYVFGLIANARVGGGTLKIHTEAELCKIFGVSRPTVCKALSQCVAEGLLVRKPSLGTFIRPEVVDKLGMYSEGKLAIGLIYRGGADTFLDDSFVIQTAKIYERLMDVDFMIRVIDFNDAPELEAGLLCKSRLDGIIWLSPQRQDIPVMRVFKSCNLPLVSTFPGFVNDEFNCIDTDYYKCGYMVAKYLLDRGHREILYINGSSPDIESAKKAGYMAAFAEYGVKWQKRLWHSDAISLSSEQVNNLLTSSGNFTAINCHTTYARFIRHEVAERKYIQIIHNVCSESAATREGTPGILLPLLAAGTMAADMLLNIIKQPKPSEHVRRLFLERKIFEPELKN